MPLVLNTKRYEAYVKVIAGEADGILIYIDAKGKIHIVGPDPGPEFRQEAHAVLERPIASLRQSLDELEGATTKLLGSMAESV